MRLFGGKVPTKSHLFKAFYFAHLYYAIDAPDYLSDWPIVKMPHGPGIDRADVLIRELESQGIIETRPALAGPYPTTEYRLVSQDMPQVLSAEAVAAIKRAVAYAKPMTAGELSETTHEYSRSWNEAARDGDELSIYIDLLDDDDYEARKQRADKLASVIREICK